MEHRKVLCPVDMTHEGDGAAAEAANLARALGAELLLVHVMGEPTLALGDPMLTGEVTSFALPQLSEEYRNELARRLDQMGEDLRATGLPVSTMLLRGAPDEAIVSTADSEHVDLIVMATHGRRGLSHLLLGSVAERVVRAAKVPVMTLKLN
ncbi:MAG TPA: universal stress protein [Polyangiales bacterium]|nr:universal stress protein [Polyangiales bacterium]